MAGIVIDGKVLNYAFEVNSQANSDDGFTLVSISQVGDAISGYGVLPCAQKNGETYEFTLGNGYVLKSVGNRTYPTLEIYDNLGVLNATCPLPLYTHSNPAIATIVCEAVIPKLSPETGERTGIAITAIRQSLTCHNQGIILPSTLYSSGDDNPLYDGLIDLFPGDNSQTGGGDGKFDNISDAIDFPSLPTISAISTKMVTMFNPSTTTLAELSNYLWKPDFVDAIAKLFQSPMEAIIDLSFVNVSPTTLSSDTIAVGWISTGITAPIVSQQYVELDCGTLKIEKYWGSALDYNPYTSMEIYLPYIGLMRLDVDDCMDSELSLKYYIDLLTGTCVAMIKVTRENLSSVLYSFSGNASAHIPLSATNMSQLIQGVLTVAAQVGIGVATGGSSAMTAVSAGTAMNVLGGKMHVEKGGRLDTTGGMLSIKTPYLIITRPIQSLPASYNTFKGYPSNILSALSVISGYTEIEYIHMDGFNALENEKQEIESLLKSGVIF